MNRRNFLKGLGFTALALSLAKIPILANDKLFLYGNGIHDDSAALQAWADGKTVYWKNGTKVNGNIIENKSFKVSKSVYFRRDNLEFRGNFVKYDGSIMPISGDGKNCVVFNCHFEDY